MSVVLTIAAGLVMVGVLVVIHEAGHFVVAKIFRIGAPVFSVGMGPRIFGVEIGGTDYRISLLPVGGYVRMAGADPFGEEDPDAWVDPEQDFMRRPVWQRLLVMLAGPAANLVLPFALFTAVLMLGEPQAAPIVGTLLADTPAERAGLRVGDKILATNGVPIDVWVDMSRILEQQPDAPLALRLERDGSPFDVTMPAGSVQFTTEGFVDYDRLGVRPSRVSSRVGVDDPASPAAAAGLQTGDGIIEVDGTEIKAWDDMVALLTPGVAHRVRYAREVDGERVEGDATLAPDPSWSARTDDPSPQANVWGLLPVQLFVGEVVEELPAETAGVLPGDRLYRVDDHPVKAWTDVIGLVSATVAELTADAEPRPLTLEVVRDGELLALTFTPKVEREVTRGDVRYRPLMGIRQYEQAIIAGAVVKKFYSLFEAVPLAVEDGVDVFTQTISVLRNLFTGVLKPKESIGGPVAIFQAASQGAQAGIYTFARMMGTISFSLGIINLLPVPVLDGGHIFFYLIEGIRGRPLSLELRERVQMVGVLALVAVMLLVTVMDVSRWLEN